MDKNFKLDIVFVVGSLGQKTHKRISSVVHQLRESFKDCRVASIHFNQEYKPMLRRNVFCNYVSDFSSIYSDRKSCLGNPLQYGYPLQYVSSLNFRHDAGKICFLITNVLPFNDSYEATIIYNNEIDCANPNKTEWNSKPKVEIGKTDEYSTNDVNSSITDRISDSFSNSPNNEEISKDEGNDTKTPQQRVPVGKNSDKTTSTPKNNEVYHEDPLQSCRHLAAMGVVLYCIENIPKSTVFKDMYAALSYITGGQYLNVPGSQLSRAIKAAIAEEVSLESLAGYVRDYLCVAWLSWGKMKCKTPSCIDDLVENVFNYLQKVNMAAPELLHDGKTLDLPSKHAKKITTLTSIGEARRMTDIEENWAAEISWVMPEVCNEVIPGYDTISGEKTKENERKVVLSECKPISKNQVMRVVIRSLARRLGLTKMKQQASCKQQTLNKTEQYNGQNHRVNATEESRVSKNKFTADQLEKVGDTNEVGVVNKVERKSMELCCHEQPMISCTQDALIIEKQKETCTNIACNVF